MKVILTENVERVGKRGDVVEVARGYANNYLIPKSLAIFATPGNLKVWEQKHKTLLKKETKARDEAENIASELGKQPIVIKAKAGEEGRLFGSVTVSNIAEAILQSKKIEIDKRKILLEENIKALGNYTVAVKLHPEVEAKVEVQVVETSEE